MIAEKDPTFKEAYDTLRRISADEEKKLQYEARFKAIMDYNSQMHASREEGIKIGEERGIKIGEERGIKIGTIFGVIDVMLDDGKDEETILEKLMAKYDLSRQEAEAYLQSQIAKRSNR